jgi:hypothetical protein
MALCSAGIPRSSSVEGRQVDGFAPRYISTSGQGTPIAMTAITPGKFINREL